MYRYYHILYHEQIEEFQISTFLCYITLGIIDAILCESYHVTSHEI